MAEYFINWFLENGATFAVSFVVAIGVVAAVGAVRKSRKNGCAGCSGVCNGCESAGKKKLTGPADGYTLQNGVVLPCIGYGTWRMEDSDQTRESVLAAIRAGYRMIDTAALYKNEKSVGAAIRESGVQRDQLFITSKVWNDAHSYEGVMQAFEQTMSNLGLEVLDLYLIHWPKPLQVGEDWKSANAEAWRAMEELYRAGKIRAIGVSNFLPHHIEALLETATICPMVNQIQYAPGILREEEVAYCKKMGIAVEAWGPFSVGEALQIEEIVSMAKRYGRTPAQIVLRWMLEDGIVPLPKSTTPQRIVDNLNIFDFSLQAEDKEILRALPALPLRHHPDHPTF